MKVGPSETFAKPCQAIASAAAGDVIEVDPAGIYAGDVCGWSKNNLTIRGVGGRARIDAAGRNSGGKAIWVIAGSNTVIENIEFSGATVPSRNGAAIRQEGANLTLRNCYIHDNETGILAASNPNSEILIEHSEFGYNGYGDGQSHNIYINNVAKFTLRYSYSHHSKIGHLVKSRAAQNYILYNRLSDEAGSNGSYELDLPNGGTSYVIGNLIEQGSQSGNSILLAYREEGGASGNPGTDLYVVNNTFVNHKSSGTFINPVSASPAVIRNNIFYGPGSITSQSGAVLSGNFSGDPGFVDAAGFDYRLQAGSRAIDSAVTPGIANGFSLAPVAQYVHPACYEARTAVGALDAGAFEYGSGGNAVCAGSTTPAPTPPVALSAVALSPGTVIGGAASSAGQIILTGAAPAGGFAVALSSSNASVAGVPASVTVPAGSTAAAFSVSTTAVTASTTVTISAVSAGITKSAALIVNPQQSRSAALASVSVSPSSLIGGAASATGQVVLTGAAPSGGVGVALSSSNSAAAGVPASVTVPAGSTSASFTVASSAVATSTTVTISAAYSGTTKAATLTVTSQQQPVALSSVSLSPSSVAGGGSSTGRLVLTGAAPVGGLTITLSVSNPAVASVPAAVTVPAGSTSASFTVATSAVGASTTVTISAAYSGTTTAATLTVTSQQQPVALSSMALSPTSVAGGGSSTGRIVLTGAAPAGGLSVTLSVSNPAVASVPGAVTVPAGSTSASFPVATAAVSASTAVTVSATYGGSTKSATLTVAPAAVVSLSYVSLYPSSVTGGYSTSSNRVVLSARAPAGGVTVQLTSSNPAVASVPASVVVPQGATSAYFRITTTRVAASTSVVISATSNGVTKRATLAVYRPRW